MVEYLKITSGGPKVSALTLIESSVGRTLLFFPFQKRNNNNNKIQASAKRKPGRRICPPSPLPLVLPWAPRLEGANPSAGT